MTQFSSRRTAIILASLFFVSGCSWGGDVKPPQETAAKKDKEPALNEIPTTETKNVSAGSEAQLMYKAEKYFETGIYSEAKQAFQSVIATYPLGGYAEFAAIKNADCVYEMGDFLGAATLYEEFYKNHPASDSTSYVLYRAARSNQLAQRGVGRDITSLQKAVHLYDDLEKKFPNSTYAAAGRQYQKEANQIIDAYNKSIAAYYHRRHKHAAAQARDAEIAPTATPASTTDTASVTSPEISDTPKPVEIETPAATSEKIEAPTPVPTIAETVLPPTEAAASSETSSEAPATPSAVPIPTTVESYFIGAVECPSSASTHAEITLRLNREFTDLHFLRKHATLQAQNGRIIIHLPATSSVPLILRCNQKLQVQVSSDGVVTIMGTSAVEMLSIDHPPRIIFLTR